jgi:hypothetical protein
MPQSGVSPKGCGTLAGDDIPGTPRMMPSRPGGALEPSSVRLGCTLWLRAKNSGHSVHSVKNPKIKPLKPKSGRFFKNYPNSTLDLGRLPVKTCTSRLANHLARRSNSPRHAGQEINNSKLKLVPSGVAQCRPVSPPPPRDFF